MRRPATLLLDLDDTIVSFSSGGRDFWREALEQELAHEADRFDALLSAIYQVSDDFWGEPTRAAQGRQSLVQSRRAVARQALARMGLPHEGPADAVADAFTWAKENAVAPFAGSLEALDALKARGFQLGLVSNGCSQFQRRKLQRYGLERYFDAIAIEGEWGVGKPHESIFRGVLERLSAAPERTWMVGDNLHADIAGSQALGIFAVWNDAHRKGLPDGSPIKPDLVVRDLTELVGALDQLGHPDRGGSEDRGE